MSVFNNFMASALHKSLDGLWERQAVASENLANYDTPGYKSKTVSFEEELQSLLQSNVSKQDIAQKIDDVNIKLEESDNLTMRMDGNNVDLEKENLEVARTTLNYMYAQRALNDYFARLRCAINDGRK